MTKLSKRLLITAIAGIGGSRYVGITWTKDNGEIRHAVINPRDFTGVKGAAASPSAQRAVATRRAEHPDLLNAIDRSGRRRRNGKPQWVSIRCRGIVQLRQGDLNVTVDLGD
jgi:hypothetical protein